ATGMKLANPDLTVVVYSGDGDLISIGGNHFIHAARRNVDLKMICVNNFIYGMTRGQLAPTTPVGAPRPADHSRHGRAAAQEGLRLPGDSEPVPDALPAAQPPGHGARGHAV